MKGMGWDDQMRGLKSLIKFTYRLETGKGEGMEWSDERYSNSWPSSRTTWRGWDEMMRWEVFNNWPSSRTTWRKIKRMGWDDQMRGLKTTIDQVHVRSGDGRRGWDKMVMRGLKSFDQVHVRSRDGWRGWDKMVMSGLKSIDQVHVRPGERWRGWDEIRWSDERY